jgi:hypothetical protein
MNHKHNTALFVLFVLLFAGCTSRVPQTAVAQRTEERTVDAAKDNRAVVERMVPTVILQLEVDGNTVQLRDAELVLLPRKSSARERDSRNILVTGWRGEERISDVSVADQRINIQENVGVVMEDRRTLNVALPAPRRVDRVEVTLPGSATVQRFPVAEVFEHVCVSQPRSELCR